MSEQKCNLKWEWDEGGEWTAMSQVMDPDMTDEPQSEWCREWCLTWRINVNEHGDFNMHHSDRLLKLEAGHLIRGNYLSLSVLQAKIELAEDELRKQKVFSTDQGEISNVPVILLPAEKYVEKPKTSAQKMEEFMKMVDRKDREKC